jgi:ketosteroid isomerase-like protein
MTNEGIGVLERFYEAWNRPDPDAVTELFSPVAEFRTSGDYLGVSPVYRGHGGVRAFWRDFYEIWETIRIDVKRYEQVGDRSLALFLFVGTGRDGVPVEREGGHIATVEDGLIVDLEAYGSWATLLEDAGLED